MYLQQCNNVQNTELYLLNIDNSSILQIHPITAQGAHITFEYTNVYETRNS